MKPDTTARCHCVLKGRRTLGCPPFVVCGEPLGQRSLLAKGPFWVGACPVFSGSPFFSQSARRNKLFSSRFWSASGPCQAALSCAAGDQTAKRTFSAPLKHPTALNPKTHVDFTDVFRRLECRHVLPWLGTGRLVRRKSDLRVWRSLLLRRRRRAREKKIDTSTITKSRSLKDNHYIIPALVYYPIKVCPE